MENNLLFVILIILVAIVLIIEFESHKKLKELLKLAKIRNSPIPDAKYFELKSSLSLVKILLTSGIVLLGFLGLNSYNSIRTEIYEEVESQVSEYDSLLRERVYTLFEIQDEYYKFNSLIDSVSREKLNILDSIENRIMDRDALLKRIIETAENKRNEQKK